MRESIAISVKLSEADFNTLQQLADENGISKSEYIRLLIQTIGNGKKLVDSLNNGQTKLEVNGYGLHFTQDFINTFVLDITKSLEKGIKVTEPKANRLIRYRKTKKAA